MMEATTATVTATATTKHDNKDKRGNNKKTKRRQPDNKKKGGGGGGGGSIPTSTINLVDTNIQQMQDYSRQLKNDDRVLPAEVAPWNELEFVNPRHRNERGDEDKNIPGVDPDSISPRCWTVTPKLNGIRVMYDPANGTMWTRNNVTLVRLCNPKVMQVIQNMHGDPDMLLETTRKDDVLVDCELVGWHCEIDARTGWLDGKDDRERFQVGRERLVAYLFSGGDKKITRGDGGLDFTVGDGGTVVPGFEKEGLILSLSALDVLHRSSGAPFSRMDKDGKREFKTWGRRLAYLKAAGFETTDEAREAADTDERTHPGDSRRHLTPNFFFSVMPTTQLVEPGDTEKLEQVMAIATKNGHEGVVLRRGDETGSVQMMKRRATFVSLVEFVGPHHNKKKGGGLFCRARLMSELVNGDEGDKTTKKKRDVFIVRVPWANRSHLKRMKQYNTSNSGRLFHVKHHGIHPKTRTPIDPVMCLMDSQMIATTNTHRGGGDKGGAGEGPSSSSS